MRVYIDDSQTIKDLAGIGVPVYFESHNNRVEATHSASWAAADLAGISEAWDNWREVGIRFFIEVEENDE